MSLRLRLIVAFFALSVVPLGAVTIFTYASNVKAVKDAAAREADLLAGELTQRMQLVTAQLSERVEHLMDLQTANATASSAAHPAEAASAHPPSMSSPVVQIAAMSDSDVDEKVAQALGEAAMLLNNVDLTGLRRGGGPDAFRGGGRSGRGQPPGPQGDPQGSPRPQGSRGAGSRPMDPTRPALAIPPPVASPPNVTSPTSSQVTTITPPPAPGAKPAVSPAPGAASIGPATTAPVVTAGAPPAAGPSPPPSPGPPPPPPDGRRMWAGKPPPRGDGPGGRGNWDGMRRGGPPPDPSGGRGANAAASTTTSPTTAASVQTDAAGGNGQRGGLRIDLAPLRQQLYQQLMPQGQAENMTPEQRQAVAREISQRLAGIQQGIQMGAAELQKFATDAQRVAAEQAKAAAKTANVAVEKAAAAQPPMKKKTALSGNRLDVSMEQDGKVVQQVNAELNFQNVLQTVFSTTRTDRGEVPFAIAKDGHLYTPTDADKKKIEGLGAALKSEGPATTTTAAGDWIVVTTADPSGSGLRFGIARPVGDSMDALRRTAARNASFGLLFIGLAVAGIVPLSGRLTRNLSALTEGVGRIAQGDFRARVPVRSHDEIGRLAGAFNQMAADVERHQHAAVEQERIRRELELGRQIQHEMLPHAPMLLGLTEVQGVSVPAREVGGDFFNYFEVGDGQIALLVGDVSGKGVGAALLMANIQASLRTRLSLGRDLSAIADAIDRDIEANSPGPVYATLFVGILDPAARTLRYVNAGHHPQYVLRGDASLERMKSTGLPVGLFAGKGYTEQRMQLGAGDVIFFYTDGCVEAENATGDMFGAERLEALLQSGPVTHSADLLRRVESGVTAFRGAVEPYDDETMMAVRVG